MNSNKPIGQSVRIGHVHLKVADLERALGFYCGVLGFETTVRFSVVKPRLFRPEVIITTSVLTPGKVSAVHHRREVRPDFTTWQFFIRPVPSWPMHSRE